MTDTKNPAHVETATAPLGRPYAETVSLEVVWAAAFAARAASLGYPIFPCDVANGVRTADEAVAALLAAHPRGAT